MSATNETEIASALAVIPAEDRDLWVRMGMAVHSALGADGYEVWRAWSEGASNYREASCKSVWAGFKTGGKITKSSLFAEAMRRGWRKAGARVVPIRRSLRPPPADSADPGITRREWTYRNVAGEEVTVTRIDPGKKIYSRPSGEGAPKGPWRPLHPLRGQRGVGEADRVRDLVREAQDLGGDDMVAALWDGMTLVVVEGETTAEAVAEAVDGRHYVSTWKGGAQAVRQTDFGALLPDGFSRVVLWPDNDETGLKAMRWIATQLQARHGCRDVRMVAVNDLPAKADAADLDAAQVVERIESARPAGLPGFLTVDQLLSEIEDLQWLVDGMISTVSLNLLVGAPKIGKSTMARNLAKAVCQGTDFLGRSTTRGHVLWCPLDESLQALRYQIRAMLPIAEQHRMQILDSRELDAGQPDQILQMMALWLGMVRRQEPGTPALIVIDTLHRAISVASLNDYAEVNNALEPLRRFADDQSACVLLTHHSRKSEGGDVDASSGSAAIAGAMDTAIFLSANEVNGERQLYTRQRNGAAIESPILVEMDEATNGISAGESVAQRKRQKYYRAEQSILSMTGEWTVRDFMAHMESLDVPPVSLNTAKRTVAGQVSAGQVEMVSPAKGNKAAIYRLSEDLS